MNKKIIWSLTILLLGSGFTPLYSQGFVLKKDIIVNKNETQDNVISFGGEILIKGKVKESAIAFGGSIVVEGEVGDVVLGFGSDITLKSTCVVKGDVVSLGGILEKEPGSLVEGDSVYFKTSENLGALLKQGFKGIFTLSFIPLFLILTAIKLSIWFILAVSLAALFPRQISFASSQIRKSFWPVFGIGFLSILIFTALIILSALLSLILIGIPIFLTLLLVGLVLKIFGRIILFHFFGESFSKALGGKHPTPLSSVTIGFLGVSFLGLIPVLGALFNFVLSILGWGVIIRTKFGNVPNWFKQSA
ncbi:hypothetical protein KGY73_01565 [bacterium]|nr:hypothetical protein [bacterium]